MSGAPALLAALALVLGGGDALAPGAGSPPWDGASFRRYLHDASGVSFEVPMLGFRVEARRLDPREPGRARLAYDVSGPGGAEVSIELFDNPELLVPVAFVEKHLAFLLESGAAATTGRAGAREAVLLQRPREPGAFAWRAAVFAAGGLLVRVTCHDADDGRAAATYARVLETLALPEARR